jgi:hypothetical protein
MSKNIFVPSTGLQLSNLAQSRIAESSKSQRDQAITLELNGSHGARLDVAAVVQDTPFETLVSVTDGQPTQSEADRILPSAAAFHDASVDPLHHGLVPLALLGAEGKNGNLVAGVNHSLMPHQNAVVATPTITVPPPGGQSTTVFEAIVAAAAGKHIGIGSIRVERQFTVRANDFHTHPARAARAIARRNAADRHHHLQVNRRGIEGGTRRACVDGCGTNICRRHNGIADGVVRL